MRKLLFVPLLLLGLPVIILTSTLATAMASDLPSPAQMLKAGKISFSADGVWQAEQKFKDAETKSTTVYSDGFVDNAGTRLNDFKIKDDQFYLATFNYGVSDWLNVFARAGLATGGKEQYSVVNSGRVAPVEVKLRDAFTWGVGAKSRVFETPGGLGATVSAQYLRYDDRSEDKLIVNGALLALDSFDSKADYQQVDLVAAVYQKLGAFTPYVGLGYNWAQFKFSGTSSVVGDYTGSSELTCTNQDNLAALAGLDIMLGNSFYLNLQGSFVSHTAASLGLTFLF